MFCTNCGSPLSSTNAFCTTCGASRESTSAAGTAGATYRVAPGAPTGVPPGVVPLGLRPLGPAERLDASFKAYFANFRDTTRVVALIAVPFGVVEAIINYSSGQGTNFLTSTQSPDGQVQFHTVNIWAHVAGILSVLLIESIVGILVVATVTVIVGAWYVGSPVEWGEALHKSLRRLPSTLLFLVTHTLVLATIFAIIVVPTVLLAAAHATAAAICVGLFGFVAALVVYLWLDMSWKATVPTIMMEGRGTFSSMRRSFRLVRGTWWSVFGTILLADLLVTFISSFFSIVIVAATAAHAGEVAYVIIDSLVSIATLILLTPLSATVIVVIAIDMRVRKEGLDLEILARSVDVPTQPTLVPRSLTWGSGFPTLPSLPSPSAAPPAPSEDPGAG